SESLDKLLQLTADVALNATFPEEEVQLRKENAKQELTAARAESAFLAEEKIHQAVFGSHPYGRFSATMQSLDKLDRKAVTAFRDTWLVPNNAALILIGQLPARAAVMKMLEKYFG